MRLVHPSFTTRAFLPAVVVAQTLTSASGAAPVGSASWASATRGAAEAGASMSAVATLDGASANS